MDVAWTLQVDSIFCNIAINCRADQQNTTAYTWSYVTDQIYLLQQCVISRLFEGVFAVSRKRTAKVSRDRYPLERLKRVKNAPKSNTFKLFSGKRKSAANSEIIHPTAFLSSSFFLLGKHHCNDNFKAVSSSDFFWSVGFNDFLLINEKNPQ